MTKFKTGGKLVTVIKVYKNIAVIESPTLGRRLISLDNRKLVSDK